MPQAGATAACNVLMRNLNVDVDRLNDRRIEVIGNGLLFWGKRSWQSTSLWSLRSTNMERRAATAAVLLAQPSVPLAAAAAGLVPCPRLPVLLPLRPSTVGHPSWPWPPPAIVNVDGPPPRSVTSSPRFAMLRTHPTATASWHAEPLSLLPAVCGPGLGRNALGPRNAGCKKIRGEEKKWNCPIGVRELC